MRWPRSIRRFAAALDMLFHIEPDTEREGGAPVSGVDDDALRFSLAGVRLKFSAVCEAGGGLTIPAKGVGGEWIVKLPSREFAGVPENAFSMMTLARQIGIEAPPVRLIDLRDVGNLPEGIGAPAGQALASRRFDRPLYPRRQRRPDLQPHQTVRRVLLRRAVPSRGQGGPAGNARARCGAGDGGTRPGSVAQG